jgi:hypothetical protein
MHCAQYIEASQCQLRRESRYRTIFDVWCSDPEMPSPLAQQPEKKGPSRNPDPLAIQDLYCGGVFGLTEIGFGGSGALGFVNPGMTGVCVTPVAAL